MKHHLRLFGFPASGKIGSIHRNQAMFDGHLSNLFEKK